MRNPRDGCGSPVPKAFLHRVYPGTQLEDALAIAKGPGVNTITIDLGSTCGFPATRGRAESEDHLRLAVQPYPTVLSPEGTGTRRSKR